MHFVEAKGILSAHNGMNLYRGCTHGCIYCDSRSLCYGMPHPFEDIEVKRNAPELLTAALRRKRAPCMIGTGSMCDPYLHAEEELGLTRACLSVIAEYGFGVSLLTKSDRVLRDIDLLARINRQAKCVVGMTLTTCDEALCRVIEPHVCTTARRCEVLGQLRERGIPTVVWLTPLLPFLCDSEENVSGLLDRCFALGVRGIVCFGVGVTLRAGDREYFYAALDRHFPGMKERYIRAYGDAYSCASPHSDALMRSFHARCAAQGVLHRPEDVFAYLNDFPVTARDEQLSMF